MHLLPFSDVGSGPIVSIATRWNGYSDSASCNSGTLVVGMGAFLVVLLDVPNHAGPVGTLSYSVQSLNWFDQNVLLLGRHAMTSGCPELVFVESLFSM